ncbi:cytochrome P450 [Turneriella parva]|uniref:Cytochrome P450 n=1 Tax=Turneriella parva (strain ATCC BAA-1111 / DSM 21527 / NCTC 11395 / H) TaxID=869212 RepID=I4B2M8_TURPD|nr:cytochrome P450 [Turneriella parva]AFM11535.1 cytochrome P450 [Turneriella parva DSM 21527]
MIPTTASKAIPGPAGLPFLGNLLDVEQDILSFLQQVATYGDVAKLTFFNRQITLVNHPDLIQQVLIKDNDAFEKDAGSKLLAKYVLGKGLLTSEGEEHKKMRKISSPAFNRQRILSYGKIMADATEHHIASWRDASRIDMHREMMALTSAIVAKALFNMDVGEKVDAIGEALEKVMRIVEVIRLPLSDLSMALPLPPTVAIKSGIATLDKIIYETIDEHLADSEDRGDLLSMMIVARKEAGIDPKTARKQLRDEAMTLFLAGHETTANALTWTFYLLSQNPAAYDLLQAEAKEVLGNRTATTDDIAQLTYTRQVVAESMRLYPPAWVIGRTVMRDYELGGYWIPKGSELWLSQYVTHRDGRWFDRPTEFHPERWKDEETEKRPKYSYFPFSAGVRNCIGEQFAWQEAILLLATISRSWRVSLSPGFKVVPLPQVTLRPKDGMKMVLRSELTP